METHNNIVFTLENSFRTAHIGVYSLPGIKEQVPDIHPGQNDIRRILRATRTLNNDEALLGEGIVRRLLGGTHFDYILPLDPDETQDDLPTPGMFEQQLERSAQFVRKTPYAGRTEEMGANGDVTGPLHQRDKTITFYPISVHCNRSPALSIEGRCVGAVLVSNPCPGYIFHHEKLP